MPKDSSGKVFSSKTVKATKPIGKNIGPIAGGDCGCVGDEGCCKDKGCCRDGKCPAELWPYEMGCMSDDFALKIRNREDLVRDYIMQNKEAVARFFRERGVIIGK